MLQSTKTIGSRTRILFHTRCQVRVSMTWDDVARATHSVVKVKYLKSDVKKNLQGKITFTLKDLVVA